MMSRRSLSVLTVAMFLSSLVCGQVINNSVSYRTINSDRYVRLYYENDFFDGTDYYYTQGTYFEVVHPALRKNPISCLLIHPHSAHVRYGLAYQHEAFTPTSYLSDNILYGDRPFAASLLLKSFATAVDSMRNSWFTSSVSTGIIGPGAGGYEIQDLIHRYTNNPRPHGWQYQVQNDVVLNYEVAYERAIINLPNHFLLNAFGDVRAGTLSTRGSLGVTLMIGFFNNPFNNTAQRKLSLYIYAHPQVQGIGYDATLQGGLLDRSSPYTISSNDISRITFENHYGIVISYRRLYLEAFQRYITKEFSSGTDHGSGGIQLGLGF